MLIFHTISNHVDLDIEVVYAKHMKKIATVYNAHYNAVYSTYM